MGRCSVSTISIDIIRSNKEFLIFHMGTIEEFKKENLKKLSGHQARKEA